MASVGALNYGTATFKTPNVLYVFSRMISQCISQCDANKKPQIQNYPSGNSTLFRSGDEWDGPNKRPDVGPSSVTVSS